jgi:hypothetical protein
MNAAGNVIYDGVNWYAYDSDGRLCATQTNGNSINGGNMGPSMRSGKSCCM